jgi:hypothetical protein
MEWIGNCIECNARIYKDEETGEIHRECGFYYDAENKLCLCVSAKQDDFSACEDCQSASCDNCALWKGSNAKRLEDERLRNEYAEEEKNENV